MSMHEPRCQSTQYGQECEDCFRDASPSQAKADQIAAAALRQEAQRAEAYTRPHGRGHCEEGFRYFYQCCLCLKVLETEAAKDDHAQIHRGELPL
jgi:hypothetical protein